MIGGVQKGGTTALAHYLSAHPSIRLPAHKEAHVFDAADFDEAATVEDVDDRFAPMFPGGFAGGDVLHGDATPISIFHHRFIERIARYNPAMRWIVLLREPPVRAHCPPDGLTEGSVITVQLVSADPAAHRFVVKPV